MLDGEMTATHEKNSSRCLHLPAGTVVAYQLMELAISDDGEVLIINRLLSYWYIVTYSGAGYRSPYVSKKSIEYDFRRYILWFL